MTTNRSALCIIWLAALLACTRIADAADATPPRYHVTDLGTLGGEYSVALGIYASGQVTGHSQTADNANTDAFLWTPSIPNGTTGAMHDLGRLGGQLSAGTSINAGGQVVGWSNTNGDPGGAFLWTPTMPGGASGTMYNLGTLGGTFSEARGINTRGQVTGYSHITGDAADHALLWTPETPNGANGTLLDLGTLGGPYSIGHGINDSGQIVGSSYIDDLELHAFLYDGTMLDLGTLGGPESTGSAINASGQVTGNSLTEDFVLHAFLWTPATPNGTNGTMLDLGTLAGSSYSSIGYGVNARGDVVGVSDVMVNDIGRSHAFLYTSDSGMVDLNTLIDPVFVDPSMGWELQVAWAVNDFGQIVVGGYFRDGLHTFLLTPVPEPVSAILFALAMVGLLHMFGRRDRRCAFMQRGVIATSCILLVSVSPASAAMFNASNVAELISAIDAANQNAVPDTITLSPGTTFTLTEANNTLHGSTGLPTIADSAELTIVGNGATIERSTATETPAFRLFDVAGGASLTMENLTLQGGLGTDLGGAIYNDGNLVLDGVTVQSSLAWGRRGVNCRCRPGGNGGAGWPGLGGGIYSSGSLLLENSILLSNQARGGSGGNGSPPGHPGRGGDGRGGGLYAAAGSATLYNSLVTGNSAVGGYGSPPGGGYGGGLFIADADVTLDEFTFAHVTSNSASTNYPNIYGPYDQIPNSNPMPGDFNEDGVVDGRDFLAWQRNPDVGDLAEWQANYGAGSLANSATVPEPGGVVMVGVALVCCGAKSARLRRAPPRG